MPAADGFLPLASWLAGPLPGAPAPEPAPAALPPPEPADAAEPAEPPPEAVVLRDVRLFRARLADAFAAAVPALVHELAYAVLGRELLLAPADIAEIAARIIAEHPAAQPIVVRHAPGDAIDAGVPAVADASLAPGDLIVAFADGEVDARFGVRLAVALEAWT